MAIHRLRSRTASIASFIAYVLYAFEICVRASAILGLVGAGGIGMHLNTALETFRYDQVASIIILTLIIVVVIDTISSTLREKFGMRQAQQPQTPLVAPKKTLGQRLKLLVILAFFVVVYVWTFSGMNFDIGQDDLQLADCR